MKIVVFGPDKRVGALHSGSVVDLARAFGKYLHERKGDYRAAELGEALVPSSLAAFIAAGRGAIDNAQLALDYVLNQAHDQLDLRGETVAYAASDVRLHAPRPEHTRIACAGSNFITHRQRMAKRVGREEREPFIWGFWKVSEPVGPGGEVVYPSRCDRLDYEGEVAVVLGRRGKDLRRADLKDYVWGVTLCCDWSIRGPREQRGPMNFAVEKNFDTSLSLGPCIVVDELDATNVDFETVVNGERRQSNNTREMVFSFGEYLEYLSRDLTLQPGDIICSGTGQGTIADASPYLEDGTQSRDLFLKPGDVVEVKSPAIGALQSRIVAKAAG